MTIPFDLGGTVGHGNMIYMCYIYDTCCGNYGNYSVGAMCTDMNMVNIGQYKEQYKVNNNGTIWDI